MNNFTLLKYLFIYIQIWFILLYVIHYCHGSDNTTFSNSNNITKEVKSHYDFEKKVRQFYNNGTNKKVMLFNYEFINLKLLPNNSQSRNHLNKYVYNSKKILKTFLLRNYCSKISSYIKTRYNWLDVSRNWQERLYRYGYWICLRDTGAGGDCLYSSVISALDLKNITVTDLRKKVANNFVGFKNEEIKAISENYTSNLFKYQKLNKEESIIHIIENNWDSVSFIDKLKMMSYQELSGIWDDPWSPTNILNNNQLENRNITTPFLKAIMVRDKLSIPGNIHWGTELDINSLEEILNIQILLFWKERGIFYPIINVNSNADYIILLYYDGVIQHFQVIGIKKVTSNLNEDFVSKFTSYSLPRIIRYLIKNDTKKDLEPKQSI
ncbi:uncharacterized protein CMU_006700 [Cryptosporidium muris RN66]|uniref:OTU domain-containing protein n=1 Tax=Cryptosporidium muris (strain RN66) TaxID=441375 RepID=B6AHQ2_CRYMR|nr:uncharacterized protein CMU_006700 [Cryptosporidium muris RN66]EEA07747.1 hypothetical protein, conserved [Cryptosporidium muris RN66]|eukprot:XP_002142096.1 hypothetical protein [Cryptosporidium muris RN66]